MTKRRMNPSRLADVMSCVPDYLPGVRRLLFEAVEEWRADKFDLALANEALDRALDDLRRAENLLEEIAPHDAKEA